MQHSHDFDLAEWPFDVSPNAPAYSTKNVVSRGYPILTVAHDHEDEWQFLCGLVDDLEQMSVVCLGCMYQSHPFIKEFSGLPRGWIAWRDTPEDPWQTEPLPD